MRKLYRALSALAVGVALALTGCELLWTTPPEALTSVNATDGTYTDQIVVTWLASPRTSKYEVWRSQAGEDDYAMVGEPRGTTFIDRDVIPNVLYWYKVKACNRLGCSEFSPPESGYAQGEGVPTVPAGVSATDAVYTDRVRVTWNEVSGAIRYEVWRSANRDGQYTLLASTGALFWDDTTVTPASIYWFRVKACNAGGCSALSSADSGYSYAARPEPPTNLDATDGAFTNRVQLTWQAGLGAAYYEVERALSEEGPYTRIATPVTGTTYTDSNVTAETVYWYRVRACNGAGCSAYAVPNSGFASAGAGGGGGGTGGGGRAPNAPGAVLATDGTHTDKVVVTWSAAPGAKRYELWRSDGETTARQKLGEPTGTSFSDTTPEPCKVYWYWVRAWNDNGFSPFSYPDSGYRGGTLGQVDKTKVKAIVLPPPSESPDLYGVRLEWPNIKDASTFEVLYSIWRVGPGSREFVRTVPHNQLKPGSDTVVYFEDTGLERNTFYTYEIQACTQTYARRLCYDGTWKDCGACVPCGGTVRLNAIFVSCNPLAPNLQTASLTANEAKVELGWTDPYAGTSNERTAKYKLFIWRKGPTDSTAQLIGTVGNLDKTSYEYTLPDDLELGKTYTFYFRVASCFPCDCGVYSNEKTVSVKK